MPMRSRRCPPRSTPSPAMPAGRPGCAMPRVARASSRAPSSGWSGASWKSAPAAGPRRACCCPPIPRCPLRPSSRHIAGGGASRSSRHGASQDSVGVRADGRTGGRRCQGAGIARIFFRAAISCTLTVSFPSWPISVTSSQAFAWGISDFLSAKGAQKFGALKAAFIVNSIVNSTTNILLHSRNKFTGITYWIPDLTIPFTGSMAAGITAGFMRG